MVVEKGVENDTAISTGSSGSSVRYASVIYARKNEEGHSIHSCVSSYLLTMNSRRSSTALESRLRVSGIIFSVSSWTSS